jgi:hypothetical protein
MSRAELPSTLNIQAYTGQNHSGGSYEAECSSPDVTKYHDPSTQSFKINGQTLASATGRGGMRGVIIPRATFGGVSQGVDHEHPTVVVIDPADDGTGLEVDLTTITPELSQQTYEAVKKSVNNIPNLSDIKRTRLAAAAFYHAVKQATPSQQQPTTIPVRVKAPVEAPAPVQTPAELPAPVEQPAPPPTRPLNLGQVAPVPRTQPPAGLNTFIATHQAPAQAEQPAPILSHRGNEQVVTFGIGDEDVPSTYSFVCRTQGATPNTGSLVLGVKSGQRGFFPKGNKPFAAFITGGQTILTLEATRIMFSHGGDDLVVYLVVGEQPL